MATKTWNGASPRQIIIIIIIFEDFLITSRAHLFLVHQISQKQVLIKFNYSFVLQIWGEIFKLKEKLWNYVRKSNKSVFLLNSILIKNERRWSAKSLLFFYISLSGKWKFFTSEVEVVLKIVNVNQFGGEFCKEPERYHWAFPVNNVSFFLTLFSLFSLSLWKWKAWKILMVIEVWWFLSFLSF